MKSTEAKALTKLTKLGVQVRMVRRQVLDLAKARLLPKNILTVRGVKRMIRIEAQRRVELAALAESVKHFNKLVNKGTAKIGRIHLTADDVLVLGAR